MTESQYLSSTDPQAMLDHLRARGLATEEPDPLSIAFVEECRRRYWDKNSPVELQDRPIKGRTAFGWTLVVSEDIQGGQRAAIIRDIWGNPFRTEAFCRNHSDPYHQSCTGDKCPEHQAVLRSWLSWNNGTVPKMAQAILGGERCECVLSSRGGDSALSDCPTCHGTGKTPPRFHDMVILHDALEDAGCTNEEILHHCLGEERCGDCGGEGSYSINWKVPSARNQCVRCKGGWLTNAVTHTKSCWVLRLLLGGDARGGL